MLEIREIDFRDFRSYANFHLKGIENLTIFAGPNATGKTNVIEGIGLLTCLRSIHGAQNRDMIRCGCASASISLQAESVNRHLQIGLSIGNNRRQYSLNGKAKKISEMRSLIPAVTFIPDDLNLIKGPESQRRRTLDDLGLELNKNYAQIVGDFERVLRHKNRLLKESDGSLSDMAVLDSLDAMLAKVGGSLVFYRQTLFRRQITAMKRLYAEISEGSNVLGGTYESDAFNGGKDGSVLPRTGHAEGEDRDGLGRSKAELLENLTNNLAGMRAEELQRKRTLTGPQLDRISFSLDGLEASKFASQGQIRSIALAWKLAEAQLIEEILGQKPVLLLDDVMSEFDSRRRDALMGYLVSGTQTFITTTDLSYFSPEILSRARIVRT